MPNLERTLRAMRLAAGAVSSCSQTRITNQPRSRSLVFVSASRALLARIFARQKFSLAFGQVPCSGQPCQKQPSTKTAILARLKTTSARLGESSSGLASREYRSPIAWSSFRMRNSAGVSRCGVARIRFRTIGEDAGGRVNSEHRRCDGPAFGRTPWALIIFNPPGPRSPPMRRRTQQAVTMNSAEVAL